MNKTIAFSRFLQVSLGLLLLAVSAPAADLSPTIAAAAKYESGASAEPLRQLERAVREAAGNPAQRAEVEAALVKLLAPTSTFEARRFACSQLGIFGSDASLAAIAELLNQPETTGMACLALSANPSPKVNELLRTALAQLSGLARVQIIIMLGDQGDVAAVKPLVEYTRSTDAATSAAAIRSLGKIATAEAFKELAALRQAGTPAAVTASLVGADTVARRGDRAAATAIYEELLATGQPVPVRRAAFEGLLRVDGDGGEQRVLAALRSPDTTLKTSAIAHARTLKAPDASAKLAQAMTGLSPAEQGQMLESLAARNDEAARAAIMSQLTAPDATVRGAAVAALAKVGDASSVPVLVKALNHVTTPAEQGTLELALASLKGGAAVDEQLQAMLASGNPGTKASLSQVLARRGTRTAVPALLEAAGSVDVTVARAAFRALAKLAVGDDLPALLDKLVELKAPAARSEAVSAAAKAVSLTPDGNRAAAAVLGALAHATDVETRCALIGLLPACGGAQALAAVKTARTDPGSLVREAAFRALADWPDAAALDLLLEVAQSATQNTERVLALRGSVRLLGLPGDNSVREVATRLQKTLAAAKTVEEKKLVLSGLANVHDPAALSLIDSCLSDPALQAEAAQAVVSLAPYVCGAGPKITLAALQKVVDLAVANELKPVARDLIEVISHFDDFILAWQVTEPITVEGKDGKALFDVVFPPEQSAGASNVKWQVMPAGGLKARPWQLDLGKLYGGDNRVAYARTWIYSEKSQPARLEFGCDDGIKVWFNGQVVIADNRGGDVIPATEKVAVTLQSGWNTVLLKVTQWSAGWGFCGRVAKPDGSSLPGIRVALNPTL